MRHLPIFHLGSTAIAVASIDRLFPNRRDSRPCRRRHAVLNVPSPSYCSEVPKTSGSWHSDHLLKEEHGDEKQSRH